MLENETFAWKLNCDGNIYLAHRSIPSLSSSLRTRLRFGRMAGESLLWSSLIDCRSGLDAFRLALILKAPHAENKQIFIFSLMVSGVTAIMKNAILDFRPFVYLCFFLLFLFFKLLWIIVIRFFSSHSGCSASFIYLFDRFTNPFRASRWKERIATFACLCCDCNTSITLWAIFHNCPTFYHFFHTQNAIKTT